jgi:hypothetical protein
MQRLSRALRRPWRTWPTGLISTWSELDVAALFTPRLLPLLIAHHTCNLGLRVVLFKYRACKAAPDSCVIVYSCVCMVVRSHKFRSFLISVLNSASPRTVQSTACTCSISSSLLDRSHQPPPSPPTRPINPPLLLPLDQS